MQKGAPQQLYVHWLSVTSLSGKNAGYTQSTHPKYMSHTTGLCSPFLTAQKESAPWHASPYTTAGFKRGDVSYFGG